MILNKEQVTQDDEPPRPDKSGIDCIQCPFLIIVHFFTLTFFSMPKEELSLSLS
jgi:hypothetical protein